MSGDLFVTPLDALIVINHLNSLGNGEAEAATGQGISTDLPFSALPLSNFEVNVSGFAAGGGLLKVDERHCQTKKQRDRMAQASSAPQAAIFVSDVSAEHVGVIIHQFAEGRAPSAFSPSTTDSGVYITLRSGLLSLRANTLFDHMHAW